MFIEAGCSKIGRSAQKLAGGGILRPLHCAGEGEAELADFTPSFLWLLRDFYLTLEEDGRQVGFVEFFNTGLQTPKLKPPAK